MAETINYNSRNFIYLEPLPKIKLWGTEDLWGMSAQTENTIRIILGTCQEAVKEFGEIEVVEVGAGMGGTTRLIATLSSKIKVYAVENFSLCQGWFDSTIPLEQYKRNLKQMTADYPNTILWEGESAEVANSFTKRVHIIFIDGHHSYESVITDIDSWESKLLPGGYWIFHDTALSSVREAIESAGILCRCDEVIKRTKTEPGCEKDSITVYKTQKLSPLCILP